MNVFKNVTALLALCAVTACGGELGESGLELGEPEFETTEQDVAYIPGYGFRNDLSDSNTRCLHNSTVNTMSCNIPPDRNVGVKAGSGWSASQKTQVESWIDGWIVSIDEQVPAWTLSRINSGFADVTINNASLPGTNKNSIHTYAKASVSGATALDDFGATGTWQKYGTVTCTVDRTKIFQHFVSPQADRVWNHAVLYCSNKGVGFGSGGSFANGMNAIVTTTGSFKSICLTPLEECMAATYDPTVQGSQIFPVCGQEFVPCHCAGLADNTCG